MRCGTRLRQGAAWTGTHSRLTRADSHSRGRDVPRCAGVGGAVAPAAGHWCAGEGTRRDCAEACRFVRQADRAAVDPGSEVRDRGCANRVVWWLNIDPIRSPDQSWKAGIETHRPDAPRCKGGISSPASLSHHASAFPDTEHRSEEHTSELQSRQYLV